MRRAAALAAVIALAGLAACGPIPVDEAERLCLEQAQGSVVGVPVPSGPMQFIPLAMIRAVVVFPVPRMPVMMKACAIRSAAKAFFSVRTIASCPTRSAKVSGRYLRASTR